MPAKKTNYHAVLGLTADATDEDIRAAYKKLALRWHPDRHLLNKEHAAQRFIDVNSAYHALMGGKDSAHSADSVSTAPTSHRTGSTGTAPSEYTARGPSSSGVEARKRPRTSPFRRRDDHRHDTAKPAPSQHQAPPTQSPDGLHPSRTCSDESRADGQRATADRTKSSCNTSKSRDRLRDFPEPSGRKSPSFSSFVFVTRSRRSDAPGMYEASSEDARLDPQPEKSLRSHPGVSHRVWPTEKPVIPPPSGRLYMASRLGLADDFIQRLTGGLKGDKGWRDRVPHAEDIPPFVSPLRAMSSPRGLSKEWLFPLPLTLAEIYSGSNHRFLVNRELSGRQTEQVEICIHVPPGTRNGTRIVCAGAGHQRRDGTFQDLAFLIEDEPNQQFSRVEDDLYLDVCVPWEDSLADGGGQIRVKGLDGEDVALALPYPIRDHATEGQVLVRGAGMPIRQGHKTVGRGDMIIRWQVVFSMQSKWQNFKRAFRKRV